MTKEVADTVGSFGSKARCDICNLAKVLLCRAINPKTSPESNSGVAFEVVIFALTRR
eukprot:CAMPEP_0183737972 /NCGR_PEP_ID=MMETSP0737-20130205/53545_1 /TAXON_ID=385413 /ORGANISM="Thalassiosira miniscula, Strain CCMP1093" /LENGTH=56 /DNA_ID=CAMNT_0025972401 /DNA_START=48 /DNA_END=215 /DNA_ORIENTATION=-